MTTVQFTYSTRSGKAVDLRIPTEEIKKFETTCRNNLMNRYGDYIISPRVHVAVSDDGAVRLSVTFLATGILKPNNTLKAPPSAPRLRVIELARRLLERLDEYLLFCLIPNI